MTACVQPPEPTNAGGYSGSSRSGLRGWGAGPAVTGFLNQAAHVFACVAGLLDEDLLAYASGSRLKQGIGETVAALGLALQIRHGCAYLGQRMLLVHGSMMPHGRGHIQISIDASFCWPP